MVDPAVWMALAVGIGLSGLAFGIGSAIGWWQNRRGR